MGLGKGSALIITHGSFWHGYQEARRIFRQQMQDGCTTAQDLHNCLEVLMADNYQPTQQPDSPRLYTVGKMTGWLISAAR